MTDDHPTGATRDHRHGDARRFRRHASLVELARRMGRQPGDLDAALREITEAAADLLDVARVNVWEFVAPDRIRCLDHFDRTDGSHSHGLELARDDYPTYFDSIPEELALAADDALTDPRTRELADSYLEPRDIGALLDAPVRRKGRLAGIVCHEHVGGPRSWTGEDHALAGLVADFVARAMDAAERRDAQTALRQSERRYRELFQRNVAGVFRTTPEGRILEVNDACARMFGYESAEEMMSAMSAEASRAYANPAERNHVMDRLETDGLIENYEACLRRKDGSELCVLENAILTEDPSSGEEVIEGTLIDITERKRLERELERLAYHDSLTGLANRRLLEDRTGRALALARRNDRQAGLVYVDLARFKRINDTLGHSAGDQVLMETARRLSERVRESDTVARVGGDEFAVLLTEVDGVAGGRAAAERLAEAMKPPFLAADRSVHVDARFGVALFPDHALDYDGLLSAADGAMYRTFSAGVGNVHVFSREEAVDFTDELVLEEELHQALEEDQLLVYYQPIVRARSGRVEGAEALLRWEHPDRGLLTASQFIRLAERTPLIQRLDLFALETAVVQSAEWSEGSGPDWVAVNLSSTTLRDETVVDRVDALLAEHGVDGQRLVIELTERSAVRNPEIVTRSLTALRELGLRIALDDFGTGHSALAYLKQFPADLMKIDGIFIRDLEPESGEANVATAIISLGNAVGMQVAAERVENEGQKMWLDSAGCDLLQGFWIGEPVPADQLPAELDPGKAGGESR